MPRRKKGGDGKDVKKVRALDAFVLVAGGGVAQHGEHGRSVRRVGGVRDAKHGQWGGRFRAWQFPGRAHEAQRHCVHAYGRDHTACIARAWGKEASGTLSRRRPGSKPRRRRRLALWLPRSTRQTLKPRQAERRQGPES